MYSVQWVQSMQRKVYFLKIHLWRIDVDSEPAWGEGEPDDLPGRVREQDPGSGEETEGARGYYKVNTVANINGVLDIYFFINII